MSEQKYYQVLGWFKPLSGICHAVRKDLSERDLKREFLKPYYRGDRILVDGETYDLMDLTSVEIIETNRPFDVILHEAEDLHDQRTLDRIEQGIFMIPSPLGDDALRDAGPNVSSKYITAPAGSRSKPGILQLVFEHPVVSGVVGTVIAALILAVFFGIGD